jgi:hypothetical protein
VTNYPADGSAPDVIAFDAGVNSLVVALVYAADMRGDTNLGEGSLTREFIDAFCEQIFESAKTDPEVKETIHSLFLSLVTAREARNPVHMITALKKLQAVVGVTVVPDD